MAVNLNWINTYANDANPYRYREEWVEGTTKKAFPPLRPSVWLDRSLDLVRSRAWA